MASDDQELKDAVDAGRTSPSTATATGLATHDRQGTDPREEEENENLSPDAEKIKPDAIATKGNKPIGAQKEPAKFTVNGSVPEGMVASTSGYVPVSAVARTQDEADTKLEEQAQNLSDSFRSTTSSRQRISDEQIQKMSGAELRAVASDRGYDFSDAMGSRGTRAAFARAQEEDTSLE